MPRLRYTATVAEPAGTEVVALAERGLVWDEALTAWENTGRDCHYVKEGDEQWESAVSPLLAGLWEEEAADYAAALIWAAEDEAVQEKTYTFFTAVPEGIHQGNISGLPQVLFVAGGRTAEEETKEWTGTELLPKAPDFAEPETEDTASEWGGGFYPVRRPED